MKFRSLISCIWRCDLLRSIVLFPFLTLSPNLWVLNTPFRPSAEVDTTTTVIRPHSPSKSQDRRNHLIQNPSFELNGQPSDRGWKLSTALRSFKRDVPPGGGTWSLSLIAGSGPEEGVAEATFPEPKGEGNYKLTAWMKTLDGWHGTIALGVRSHGEDSYRKWIIENSPEWKLLTLEDSLNLGPHDSVVVRLSAGFTEVVRGEVLFDLVQLERK